MPPAPTPSPDALWRSMPANRRRLAMAGTGVVAGWGLYNVYLAPAAARGDALFRPTAVAIALALVAMGFVRQRMVRWATAAVVALAVAAVLRITLGAFVGAGVGVAVGWAVDRAATDDRRASALGMAFALLVTAAWAGALAMAMTGRWPAAVDGVDPATMQQALQMVIVPAIGWFAWRLFARADRRPWGLVLWGLTLQLAVLAALTLEKTITAAAAGAGAG